MKKKGRLKRSLTPIARKLRREPTEAEKRVWKIVRSKGLGVKFRRQVAIGSYVVDFVCFEKKLVLEIDGGQHSGSQEDMARDEWLAGQGFEVLRFWNHDVLGNLEGVCWRIRERLTPPP